ncbi:hypothetical protein F383_26660 [Gossypium arboreum]|uniref:Uncharacterized protein n=3 Tax=Gossypium TaxID=3633 RepID=A0A5J5WX57_GOSBA|nr:hypothetical protein ES319_D01G107400v1 [Gossypium barbadense]KAG4161948.1 hypothetical protein ERO13_D01G087401v2 [Gossypium hirsutum]KHG03527.1 hypothetical protein F383_26660 [Gossypium arboreum]TYI96986.1 hypothetical protein E1A91_D01G111900v1 [Gossypium mustelinum]KAB2096362.1 hypothetical protein ES319_A01G103600v1 [Gossypium barbadense]
MVLLKGQPLVARLAAFSKYVVLPGSMVAAIIYSPPNYDSPKKGKSPN